MKNRMLSIFSLLVANLIVSGLVFSQQVPNHNSAHKGWSTNNPFHTDVFVENYGQFDTWAKSASPIKFAINNSDRIFFTQQGLIFRLDKFEKISEEEREQREHNEGEDTAHKVYYVSMNWEGCNPNAEIIVSDASEGYYTFGEKGYENIKAKGFKKLLYKNLYPGVDAEYTIPEKGGIKYKLIVQAGADLSVVKMHYGGDVENILMDKDSNIIIKTEAGDIIDHAPTSYFEDDKGTVESGFQLNNNVVSFYYIKHQMSNATHHILIIDPWTTVPTTLISDNAAYDIEFDNLGNVYVAGGTTTIPHHLAKYSPSGNIIWTFTNPTTWDPTWFGYSKFSIIPQSGTIFIGEGWDNLGPKIMKINTNGFITFTSVNFTGSEEIWKIFYNRCSGKILGFGGGTATANNLQLVADTNLSGSNVGNFNGFVGSGNDVADAIMDNNGDFFALMAANNLFAANHLMKSLYSTNYSPPCSFDVNSGFNIHEGVNNGIPGFNSISLIGFTNRENALALNDNYLFSYDGNMIAAWDKTSGNQLGSIIIDTSSFGGTTYYGGENRTHEGIAVDNCNNVYVGGSSLVHVFSFDGYTFTTFVPLANDITNEVYDISIDKSGGLLYVCGLGFVSVVPVVSCYTGDLLVNIVSDSCANSATALVNNGTPPYSYFWSNGQTSSTISSVPSGTYSVTITDNSCNILVGVDTITLNPQLQITITPSIPIICSGDSIALHVSSNMQGTNFFWYNGSTDSTINVAPIITATYTVSGINNTCNNTAEVMVIVNQNSLDTLTPTICMGNYFAVGTNIYTIQGIYLDTLVNHIGCDSIITTNLTINPVVYTVINPVICPGESFTTGIHVYTISGMYQDTLSNTLGCDSIITTNLTVNPVMHTTINPVICHGQSYTIGIYSYTAPGIYIDTLATVHQCDSIVTIDLSVITINPSISPPIQICKGELIELYANGGTSYYWNPQTWLNNPYISNPVANPDSTITYFVTINDGDCFVIDSVNVSVGCPAIYFPNSFTPNGDGNNDMFFAKGEDINNFSMIIFDRWGEEIFSSNDISQGWNGTYKGKECAEAVYTYAAQITFTTGERIVKRGSVTLIR